MSDEIFRALGLNFFLYFFVSLMTTQTSLEKEQRAFNTATRCSSETALVSVFGSLRATGGTCIGKNPARSSFCLCNKMIVSKKDRVH